MCLSFCSKPRSTLEPEVAKLNYKVFALASSQFELESQSADRSKNELANETLAVIFKVNVLHRMHRIFHVSFPLATLWILHK